MRVAQIDGTADRRGAIGDVSPSLGFFPHILHRVQKEERPIRRRRRKREIKVWRRISPARPQQSDAWHVLCILGDIARRIGEKRLSNAMQV
jgi:hypothetical protein